jgi:hypothetical protein
MTNIAVKTSTVCKGFGQGESRTEVLKDVNFEARMGELLMLVARNKAMSPWPKPNSKPRKPRSRTIWFP